MSTWACPMKFPSASCLWLTTVPVAKVLPHDCMIEAWIYLSPISGVTSSSSAGNIWSVCLLSRYGCGPGLSMRQTSSSCPLARQVPHQSSAVHKKAFIWSCSIIFCKFLRHEQCVCATMDYLACGSQDLGCHGRANVNQQTKIFHED